MSTLLVHQINSSVDLVMQAIGYLDGAISDQGFIADGSYSDLRLVNAEKRLRAAADAVRSRREGLLANVRPLQPANQLVAAE